MRHDGGAEPRRRPALRVLLACALPAAVAALSGEDPTPVFDKQHPDKPAPARSNAQLAQPHGQAASRASRSKASRACFASAPMPGACTTGDAGPGRWQKQGTAGLRRWHPAACELRYVATQRELRCVSSPHTPYRASSFAPMTISAASRWLCSQALASRRIAMVGDSLIRNLFEGLAHHAGLVIICEHWLSFPFELWKYCAGCSIFA